MEQSYLITLCISHRSKFPNHILKQLLSQAFPIKNIIFVLYPNAPKIDSYKNLASLLVSKPLKLVTKNWSRNLWPHSQKRQKKQ